MTTKRAGETLRRIADKVLTQDDLAKQIIIQKGNTYQAFDQYIIEETEFGWRVRAEHLRTPKMFNTPKVALAWCILHKVGNTTLAATISWLDYRIAVKQFDIDMITYTLDNAEKLENRSILLARLMEDINNRQVFKKQLAKCVKQAKQIKIMNYKHKHGKRIHKKL